ncbi:MAG TPA: hypothetical protein VNM66_05720, partial [Thermodesulfobacteriota bacterium]|nr:hypothetical protein [Thermodesulfobacteriota bacterium]
PRLGPLYKVHVTKLDGDGARALWFARRRRDDGPALTAVCFLVDEEAGVRDGFAYDEIGRAEYDALVRKARREEVLVETDFGYAVALLRDALARNAATRTPLPPHFLLLRRFFEETDLSPAPYVPTFPEFDEAALLDDLAALAESGALLDRDELSGWLIATERTWAYAEEIRRLTLLPGRRAAARQSLSLYRRFYEELVRPRLPRYRDRLRLTADLLRRRPGRRRDVRLALVAAAHLDRTIAGRPRVPATEQPFVHRLICESLDLAVAALDDGYDVRRRPDRHDPD